MLIPIETPSTRQLGLTFPSGPSELAGQRYRLGLSFCDSPVCGCGRVHLRLFPESLVSDLESEPAEAVPVALEVSVDIWKRELDAGRQRDASSRRQIAADFVDALSAEDWDLLTRIFYGHKRKVTDETPDDEIEASFPGDEIEQSSIMVRLHEILPYAEPKILDIEGRSFQLDELYCVRSDCSCTEVLVGLLELVEPSDVSDVAVEAPALFIDYETRSWRIEHAGKEHPPFLRRIAEALKTDDQASFFRRRHARLKALYRGYRARHPRRVATTPVRRRSVGRNDPCPCGSGKKYKKCCLSAPMAS